jgi:hypothetical protein
MLYSEVRISVNDLIIDGAAGGETKRRHDVTFPLYFLGTFCLLGIPNKQNILFAYRKS